MPDSLDGQQFKRNTIAESVALGDDAMLFDPQSNHFLRLNATASFLWSQLAEPVTCAQLADAVCDHFAGADAAVALRDVEEALRQLLAQGVVVVHE